MKIHVLMDNWVNHVSLVGEWGLSLLIELDGSAVLLDTGQSGRSLENAEKLEVLPRALTGIVLSHGHYDHTGGFTSWLGRYPGTRVLAHPGVFDRRFSVSGESSREVGSPRTREEAAGLAELVLSAGPQQIAPGLSLTGQIPRVTGYEDTGGPFYYDPQGRQEDPLPDDQALVAELDNGLAVVCGCAHAGVINTLIQVEKLFPDRPVRLLLGGLHLHKAKPDRLEKTIAELQARVAGRICTGHCTGREADARLFTAFGERFGFLGTGLTVEV